MSYDKQLSPAEHLASTEYKERLARDTALTTRIKEGYSPAEPTASNPHPTIVEGSLTEDAVEALGELYITTMSAWCTKWPGK